MPIPEQRIVRNSIVLTEKDLVIMETRYGKESPEYRNTLKKLARLWSVLRMTRNQDEFLHEISG